MASEESWKQAAESAVAELNQLNESWAEDIRAISVAIIEGREVAVVSDRVDVRNLVWAIKNRTQAKDASA